MHKYEQVNWWGNIIDRESQDYSSSLLGANRNEEEQEANLEKDIKQFVERLQNRRKKAEQLEQSDSSASPPDTENRKRLHRSRRSKHVKLVPHFPRQKISTAWKDDQTDNITLPTLHFRGFTTLELKHAISDRQQLHGKCDPQMIIRLAEARALLSEDPSSDEQLLLLFDKLHEEAVSKHTSPLSLPSIIMFTVNDNQSLTTDPTPPQENISMFVIFYLIK